LYEQFWAKYASHLEWAHKDGYDRDVLAMLDVLMWAQIEEIIGNMVQALRQLLVKYATLL